MVRCAVADIRVPLSRGMSFVVANLFSDVSGFRSRIIDKLTGEKRCARLSVFVTDSFLLAQLFLPV
jgi:hypothetical protein